MTVKNPILLAEIDAFLDATGMSESYFGKRAASNSELIDRLRNGGRVWPETEAKIRSFIIVRNMRAPIKGVSSKADIQGQVSDKTQVAS